MKHVITDKQMAAVGDTIEEAIADALTNVYNDIAYSFGVDQVTSSELFEAGEAGQGELFDMRDLALKLFAGLGIELEGDGKGF